MEQAVPGSQNEHFFELLHPHTARGPPPDPSSSVDAASEESTPQDTSPVHDIPPSYDFQLTHSPKFSDPAMSDGLTMSADDVGAKVDDPPPFLYRGSSLASSGDNHLHSGDYHHHTFQGSANDRARVPDQCEPPEVVDGCNQLTMATIDQTIKSCMDNLLHVLQNVSERVSQLENTVHGLESTIAGLKSVEGEKQDQSHERLLKLEWLVAEVHAGIRLLHDKQVVDDTKSHFSKLQIDEQNPAIGGVRQTSDGWQQPRGPKDGAPHVSYSEQHPQLPQHPPPPQYPPPTQSHFSHGPLPPPPDMQKITPSQNVLPLPASMNTPSNTPASQPSYPPQHLPAQPGVPQGPPSLHSPQLSMQVVPFHTQPPSPQSLPQASYHLPMETAAYGHMQPQQYNPAPPTPPPSSAYLPEPPQYTGGPRQQPLPPQDMHPPPQQHNPIGSQHMYDGRMSPQASNMAPSYPQPPQHKPAHAVPMYEPSSGSGYGNPSYRAAQPVPSAPSGGGGGGGYPRLPTAQPLQHSAIPAAARVSSGPSVRSPIDEVIEKVALMGFPREQVRVVVRQLLENGQSVDMNMVLDKLMNGGDSSQPSRGWFGRG